MSETPQEEKEETDVRFTVHNVSCVHGGGPRECFCQGRRYTCARCKRFVPECFGASDEHWEVCDDCWVDLESSDE